MTEMSKEYATALFMLACELGAEKEYAVALDTIVAAMEGSSEYVEFLASPSIPVKERLDAIEQAFASAVPENVLSFMQLLCEKGRIRSFNDCVTEYGKLLEFSQQISVAKIVSAVALTEDEKAKLKAKLEKMCGHTVNMSCSVDDSLLGGMIVDLDGKVMDGSLRNRLHEVKDVMSR